MSVIDRLQIYNFQPIAVQIGVYIHLGTETVFQQEHFRKRILGKFELN